MTETVDDVFPEPEAEEDEIAKRRAERDAEDLRWVLSTPQGRRFLASLLSAAQVDSTSFDPNPFRLAWVAGRRALGSEIDGRIRRASPGGWLQMMSEGMHG